MLIALDYDNTFSADGMAWHGAMYSLRLAGHEIVGVTARNRDEIIDDDLYMDACSYVVYCAGNAKKAVMKALAQSVDVWIDDHPQYILHSYADVHGSLWPVENAGELTYVPFVVYKDRTVDLDMSNVPRKTHD